VSHGVIGRLEAAGFKVKTHEEWGSKQRAVYAARLRDKPIDIPVPYGFLHITVTESDEPGVFEMQDVEAIGMSRFGSGVSYNWVLDHRDHTIYQGQFLEAKGTHTVNEKNVEGFPFNLNYFGHAVAILGNVDTPVCNKCVECIAAIFAAEQLQNVMQVGAPILPHRKFANKACPGDIAMEHLDDIQRRTDRLVKAQALNPPTLVDKANELLEQAKKKAEAKGFEKRAERLQEKIDAGPDR